MEKMESIINQLYTLRLELEDLRKKINSVAGGEYGAELVTRLNNLELSVNSNSSSISTLASTVSSHSSTIADMSASLQELRQIVGADNPPPENNPGGEVSL